MNQYFGSDSSMTLGEAIQKMRRSEPQGDMANKTSSPMVALGFDCFGVKKFLLLFIK